MAETEKKTAYEWHHSRFWHRLLRALFAILFRTVWPLRVKGAENVPRSGSGIVVSNHMSYLDPFVIGYGANRLVSFMGKEELFRAPVVGFLVRQIGGFPVNRTRRDPAAMRIALTLLNGGEELVGLFPEGTRNTTGELLEFQAGAVRLAAKTRNPIIPARITGTDRAFPPGKFLRPARLTVTFGPPFEVTELYERNTKGEAMERALQTLKERVAELA